MISGLQLALREQTAISWKQTPITKENLLTDDSFLLFILVITLYIT